MSGLDSFLPGVVIDRIVGRYLLRPAAGDPVEGVLVDAGHILRGGQDGGCKKEKDNERKNNALLHDGPPYLDFKITLDTYYS